MLTLKSHIPTPGTVDTDHHQHDRVWSHPGDEPPAMLEGDSRLSKRESELVPTSVSLSAPDLGYTFLPSYLPRHDGSDPQIVSSNKPFLPGLFLFFKMVSVVLELAL